MIKNIDNVPVPPRLAMRPRDRRGLPIPAGVMIKEDGVPDFRVIDISRWLTLLNGRCCGLCGEALGKFAGFVGGPLSHKSRCFTDLPMHRSCAEYALQICPYLAVPNFKYTATDTVKFGGHVVTTVSEVSPEQPEKFFLGMTEVFQPFRHGESVLIIAGPWDRTDWWRGGRKVKE